MNQIMTVAGGVAGLALLYYGAEYLIKGGVAIAEKLHIPSLVIGLTLVSMGTSAPELVVSLIAASQGSGDISVGNVIGSNICNLGLILGLCAIIRPLKINPNMLKLDFPVLLSVTVILGGMLYICNGLNRICSGILLLIGAGYMYRLYKNSKKQTPENHKENNSKTISIAPAILFFIGGIAGLVIGAKLFVNSAVFIAQAAGLSEAVIGLTIVAVGTSLPELATSCVATIKGEDDIAAGNVIGSNIWNILCIMGISPLLKPIVLQNLIAMDLICCLAFTLPLLLLYFHRLTVPRYLGVIWLIGYICYIVALIFR